MGIINVQKELKLRKTYGFFYSHNRHPKQYMKNTLFAHDKSKKWLKVQLKFSKIKILQKGMQSFTQQSPLRPCDQTQTLKAEERGPDQPTSTAYHELCT